MKLTHQVGGSGRVAEAAPMLLWEVLHYSQGRGYVVFSFVVRAATEEDAIALTQPWESHTATAEPLTYEGEPVVVLSDTR